MGSLPKPLKRAIWNTPGLHAEGTIWWRILSVLDGACYGYCLVLSTVTCHASSSNHLNHQNQPALMWHHKLKWLDFGSTPERSSLNLHPHLGLFGSMVQ